MLRLVDVEDARLGERAVGQDAHLRRRCSSCALRPSSFSAIASRPIVTCSPVEATTSSSRGFGLAESSFASAEQAVGLARHRRGHDHDAGGPARWQCATRRATFLMRSVEPTEVPPYFWTISAIAGREAAATRRASQRAERERGVGAAEAEGVGQRAADRSSCARCSGTKSRSHCGIDVDEVDGRRRDLVAHREHGEHRLDAAGGAEQVAGHRLGRAHRELVRVVAEGALDRRCVSARSPSGVEVPCALM